MKRSLTFVSAMLSCALMASQAYAVPITVSSYSYQGTLSTQGGVEFASVTFPSHNGELTDGAGQAGFVTPSGQFYIHEGGIYNQLDVNVPGLPQPEIVFDLGAVVNLASVEIHYGMHHSFAVYNPASVDVLVGASLVGNFTGFTDSSTVANNTVDSLKIDLTGQSGQFVTLQLRGTTFNSFGNAWLGLTEVEFEAIPEPISGILFGIGLVGLALSRRRRRHGR